MITHKLLKLLIRSSRPGAMFPAPDRRLERTTPQTAHRLSGRIRELAAHVGSVSSVWRTLPSALSRSGPTHKVLKLLLSSSWPWGMFPGPSPSRADPRPLTVFPVGPEKWRLGVGRAFRSVLSRSDPAREVLELLRSLLRLRFTLTHSLPCHGAFRHLPSQHLVPSAAVSRPTSEDRNHA